MKKPVPAHLGSDLVHCKHRRDGVGQLFLPSKDAVALAEFSRSKPCFSSLASWRIPSASISQGIRKQLGLNSWLLRVNSKSRERCHPRGRSPRGCRLGKAFSLAIGNYSFRQLMCPHCFAGKCSFANWSAPYKNSARSTFRPQDKEWRRVSEHLFRP